MKVIKKWLDKTLEFLTAGVMGVLVLDVLWQVATRFILKNPSSWTEELATYLLIWVGLLGSAVALKRGAHLGIDYFVGKLMFKQRLLTEIFVFVCVIGFALSVLVFGGLRLVTETFLLGQVSPAIGIRLGYVYLAVPIAGFFISMYALEFLFQTIKKLKSLEQTQETK